MREENIREVALYNGHWRRYCQHILKISNGFRFASNNIILLLVTKGGSNFLLRKAVTRKQMLADKAKKREDEETLKNVPGLPMQIDDLNKEIRVQQYEIEKNESERQILKQLYDKGYIDNEGNIIK